MPLAAPPAVALTTSLQTLHTATSSQIVEVIVANSNAAAAATATINWTDASAGNAPALLAFTDVAAKDAIVTMRKTLEAGDKITGLASVSGSLTASVNVVHSE